MRSHGWSGQTPSSDEEAVNRILDAVDSVVAEGGSAAVRISDLARILGVSRQTVYRYFPSAEALLIGSQMRAANGFLDRLANHLRGWTNPAAALVEGVAFTAEEFAGDPLMARVMVTRLPGGASAPSTAGAAISLGREMFRRYDVDWEAHGFDHAAIDDLIEVAVRTLQSVLLDPPERQSDPVALRRLLGRWLGPAVLYQQLTRDVDALTALASAGRRMAPSKPA
ncbi:MULTISPECIES: TetR/AcrR family transcriptional regulator [unclassified Mycobacterium]|uniref:TetR/AcrR family transcriptional regulator n=1 Tax=unclassified Mycobacterium TaxID=2642494 RepID=UPI0007FD1FFF|nr:MULTISPECIES: TetR/AcrR family transcriptional regulator [unclassified Mycobacterium]OBG65624.1 TetR family transcriptional regulator [Mycobacterium sp. E188]OBG66881.1 TetR family transcriptional regulator [Mycobacterium sp. E735]OBG71240.1 TetR family transcriptional regulator [Mycobacterium sp. E3298]OBH29288.1 TetR family transcriptional regulator [Mycobacterium sp. E1715]OBH41771.1 TetR family transcriptional regulator [Mycobacterium sp. E183]